jgi:hypothetical protein
MNFSSCLISCKSGCDYTKRCSTIPVVGSRVPSASAHTAIQFGSAAPGFVYTTHNMENLNRGIRKCTKTKVRFIDNLAAPPADYLTLINIEKNGASPYSTGATSYSSLWLSLRVALPDHGPYTQIRGNIFTIHFPWGSVGRWSAQT